jgi:Alpha-2,8-polysialyltransferase (POLYST)
MKHLFFVHSSITFLMAKQIIKEEELDKKDCILIFDRIKPFENEDLIQTVFPFETFPNDFFKVQLNSFLARKNVIKLNQYLSEVAHNQRFVFYAPKAQANYFYLTINHPNCDSYFFMEEGSGVYSFANWHNPKKEIWLRQKFYDLNFFGKVPAVKHFYDGNHPKYKGVYCLHETAFKGFENKRILNLPFEIKQTLASFETVLVFSCEIEFGFMNADTYRYSINKLIAYLIKNNIQKAHYKLHPGQKKDVSIALINEIIAENASKIQLIELEQHVILEEIAVSSPNVSFYICTSSIGLYATLANKKVYSYINFVREKDPEYQRNYKLPDFYVQKLIRL